MKYDEIGEWSEIKLEIIKKYAGAYTTILSNQEWCRGYAYIDAFAGADWHVRKAAGELVPGSPLNALLVKPPFTEYHYIDLDNERVEALEKLTQQLMENLKKTSVRRKAVSEKTGSVEYDEFWPRYSKPIIDKIDTVLATHYGFTPEELDFIINYDIKYRMGKELEGDNETE
jgi:hypothetical protein